MLGDQSQVIYFLLPQIKKKGEPMIQLRAIAREFKESIHFYVKIA